MPEKKISILHIATDEKFINAANYIFEKAFPGCNHFVIRRSRLNSKLEHVEKKKNVQVVFYNNGLVKKLSEMTQNYDCVFLHGISAYNSTIYLQSKQKEKFIGMLWGAELYTEENLPDDKLVGDLTASIKLPESGHSLKERIKELARNIIYCKPSTITDATRLATSELRYISTLHEEDFNYFRERNLISEKCRHIPFAYYPLEFIMQGNESATVNGNNILLGNSASFTNNHLEALDILRRMDTGIRKIVAPLSYGNSRYADYIQDKGTELLGENFIPLRKFMPLNEYTSIIRGCGITIMNHYRQQAEGNILTMLWLGSKVYLNESNTFYQYLKRVGAVIFSMEKDFSEGNLSALENLSHNEIKHNRDILKKEIGEERIIERLRNSVQKYFLYHT
ncbi:MAG: TDP-N-acetylfucosamine:lipid II N-acetylfucosaminyltransferase [Bacteroidales bacterium]|nr:TDP-N-acetylfucosamine:lipid II N-acetylfucosaminyltransferase [Bacteroidales bacterium]